MFSSTGSNHPIIPRQSDLLLNPHYVTFHASDRDKSKYPSSSQWATRLPENINSIRSLHLVDCMIPHRHMFVFKNDYQNLAFMIKVKKNNSTECDFDDTKTLFENCLEDPKCTPRLNLSRPLVPHSNVKFNEQTKGDYVKTDTLGNVISYQLPSTQLQNSFSAPQNCTSYQNNLIGLDNMQNNTCYNKVLCSNKYEKEVGADGNCDCVDITPTSNYNEAASFIIKYIDCCNKLVTMNYNKGDTIKCIKTEYHSGFPYWAVGSEGHVAEFTVSNGSGTTYNYVINITDCGQDDQVIEIRATLNGVPITDFEIAYLSVLPTKYTVTPSVTVCCTEEGGSDMANIPCAPRSMCEQETALLRVNATVPPYIRKMRELEEAEKKGNTLEFNYDGCNAHCNPISTTGLSNSCNYLMIRIKEGFYTGQELAQFLQGELTKVLKNAGIPDHDWIVHFSPINCKFYFYLKNTNDVNDVGYDVEFRFDYKINYQCQNFSNKNQPIVWNNNKWWGLGYYLGFNKERYSFKNTNFKHIHKADLNDCSVSTVNVLNENYLLQPPNILQVTELNSLYTNNGPKDKNISGLVACNASNLFGPSVLYMELEKYNNCDEIYHSSSNTNSTYNNTYSGATKALFAKLSVSPKETGSNYYTTEIQFITHMKNQLEERINKLEFKFRFHDGRYVYIDETGDLTFSIQFNCAEENALKQNISSLPDWTA